MPRYANRIDLVQPEIVSALERAGFVVWVIGKPVDLACRRPSWPPGMFQLIECKTPYGKRDPKARVDARQSAQIEFIEETRTPVVTSAEEALMAVGALTVKGLKCS